MNFVGYVDTYSDSFAQITSKLEKVFYIFEFV